MSPAKKKPIARKPARTSPEIDKLKITLEHVAPSIWRRVLVPSAITFAGLHRVIQESMGWLDCHLHVFRVGDRHIGMRDEDSDEDGRKIRVASVVADRGAVFGYEYDFGSAASTTRRGST